MRSPHDVIAGLDQGPVSIALPAAKRLNALTQLDPAAVIAIRNAAAHARYHRAHAEVQAEGQPITETVLFLDGWAARIRQLADGRRAIMNFLLPGDLIGFCDQEAPLACSTVVALTPVTVCAAPARSVSPSLDRAYSLSRAVEEAHLLSQITRLSRLSAYDRFADLMLELLERLELSGLATRGAFHFPLTQELISDAVGLSTVHLNRMVQQARKAGILRWTGHRITIPDPAALREAIGRQRVRVSALP